MAADKPFNKMNKTELVEATTFLKLTDEVEAVAKDPNAPTNANYIAVLEAFKEKQDKANPEVAKEVAAEPVPVPEVGKGLPAATASEIKATMAGDLSTAIPVIVTDHDTSISVDEDEEGRTVGIRWGNPVIGMSTTNVPLHGRMQYLPKGAVIRLKKISLASHVKDAAGKEKSHRTRKRFSVAHTQGWTEAEFQAHKDEQALHENLDLVFPVDMI